jgi:hypothetical protein
MKYFEGLEFDLFKTTDIEVYTEIMKRAFNEDAKRHLNENKGGPPGYDNGEFIRKWAFIENAHAYKVLKDRKPIGMIIVMIHENNENYLGNMFVDPEIQDRGIGSIIWRFIESEFTETKIWRTDTPGFSKRNHNFYVNKCGFHVIKIENPGNKYEELYILEKIMKKA